MGLVGDGGKKEAELFELFLYATGSEIGPSDLSKRTLAQNRGQFHTVFLPIGIELTIIHYRQSHRNVLVLAFCALAVFALVLSGIGRHRLLGYGLVAGAGCAQGSDSRGIPWKRD